MRRDRSPSPCPVPSCSHQEAPRSARPVRTIPAPDIVARTVRVGTLGSHGSSGDGHQPSHGSFHGFPNALKLPVSRWERAAPCPTLAMHVFQGRLKWSSSASRGRRKEQEAFVSCGRYGEAVSDFKFPFRQVLPNCDGSVLLARQFPHCVVQPLKRERVHRSVDQLAHQPGRCGIFPLALRRGVQPDRSWVGVYHSLHPGRA